MKILKHLSLPLLATFCVSALPLSSIFAAEEEKHHQDARGLDNRRSEQSLPGRLTVAKFLTPSGILQPLTKLSAALTGAISGLLKTMRDQGPPFTIYGPILDKDLLIRLPAPLLAEIGEFLSPVDFTHFCLLLKKAGHSGKIFRKALSLSLTTSKEWMDHLDELRCIPELTVWHEGLGLIEDDGIRLYAHSLPHIKRMYLGSITTMGLRITDDGLKHIGTLANLQELTLKSAKLAEVTDEGLKHICTLAKLKKLKLSFQSKITGVGLQYLHGLSSLQCLLLEDMKVTDADIQHLLHGLKTLRQLELHDMDGMSDAGLQHLIGLPALRQLGLSNICRISGAGLQHLSGLSALRQLELKYMDWITDADLQHLSGLLALEGLGLEHLDRVTDGGIQHLRGLSALRQLELKCMNEITDAGLEHLRGLLALERLELESLDRVTDGGIRHLIGLPAFQKLEWRMMRGVTDGALRSLIGQPALQHLNGV
jgi:hypothetical protein